MSPTAAAAVEFYAHAGYAVPWLVGTGCMESGGPAWLFEAMLLCGVIALVAAAWWVLSWSDTHAARKQTVGQRLSRAVAPGILLLVIFVSGGFASMTGPMWMLIVTTLLGTVLVVATAQRRSRAVHAGTQLPAGWRIADRTVRWGAPTLTGIAILGAAGAIGAQIALGNPC